MESRSEKRIYQRFDPDYISEDHAQCAQDIADEIHLWLALNQRRGMDASQFISEFVTRLGQIVKKHGAV